MGGRARNTNGRTATPPPPHFPRESLARRSPSSSILSFLPRFLCFPYRLNSPFLYFPLSLIFSSSSHSFFSLLILFSHLPFTSPIERTSSVKRFLSLPPADPCHGKPFRNPLSPPAERTPNTSPRSCERGGRGRGRAGHSRHSRREPSGVLAVRIIP